MAGWGGGDSHLGDGWQMGTQMHAHVTAELLRHKLGGANLATATQLSILVDTREEPASVIGECLPHLARLVLDGSRLCSLRDLGTSLRSLTSLSLVRCGLRDLDGLPALTSLVTLNVARNAIVDVSGVSFMEALRDVNCAHNALSDDRCMLEFSTCPSLTRLVLSGNPLCTGTSWHAAGWADLLPGVELVVTGGGGEEEEEVMVGAADSAPTNTTIALDLLHIPTDAEDNAATGSTGKAPLSPRASSHGAGDALSAPAHAPLLVTARRPGAATSRRRVDPMVSIALVTHAPPSSSAAAGKVTPLDSPVGEGMGHSVGVSAPTAHGRPHSSSTTLSADATTLHVDAAYHDRDGLDGDGMGDGRVWPAPSTTHHAWALPGHKPAAVASGSTSLTHGQGAVLFAGSPALASRRKRASAASGMGCSRPLTAGSALCARAGDGGGPGAAVVDGDESGGGEDSIMAVLDAALVPRGSPATKRRPATATGCATPSTVTTRGGDGGAWVAEECQPRTALCTDPRELVAMLRAKPKTVPQLHSRERFQQFFTGYPARQLALLLHEAYAHLPEAERDSKVAARMALVAGVVVGDV